MTVYRRTVVLAVGCALCASVVAAEVAVLVEPGMLNYGGTPSLSPSQAVDVLRDTGVPVTALRAHEVADPTRFSADLFSVLVMDYGNAFPLSAFESVKAFHRTGGCLVMTGVPFCHPCVSSAPEAWRADGSGGRWGANVQWVDGGRGGGRCVRVTHTEGSWSGCTSSRVAVRAGDALTLSAWVRSADGQQGLDELFVRFFRGSEFLGQAGPDIPRPADEWARIRERVTVPEGCTAADVSLQVRSTGGFTDLDDVSLTLADGDENLVSNPGFETPGAEWRDRGHSDDYFGHDAAGIGTGGYGGPAPEAGRLVAAAANPLRVTDALLPRIDAHLQWLDTESLAPEDEVLPVVEQLQPQGERYPIACAIRHNCPQFSGARDVWVGQAAVGSSMADRYAAAQFIARGVAWCLKEKGELSAERFDALIARLDDEDKPEPMPSQIEIVDEPRPWGDTFYPRSKPPARRLLAVDVRDLSYDERLALTCLQALTSRQEPKIWLVFREERDVRWLKWHKQKGYIDDYTMVEDWRGLFRQFAGAYRGAVVPDDSLYQGVLLACNLSGLEDFIVAPPDLAKELGIEIKQDLRGRFETYAEGMGWLWDNYADRFNHHLCIYAHPVTTYMGTVGYDIQWRGLIFWVTGTKDGESPGADPIAEREVMARIFAELPPNIGMRGFPWGGEGIGLGEGGGVQFCGAYGKGLTCNDHTPNQCVTSGVRIERLKPPAPAPAPALERDKVYIALTMSDGDNLNTWADYFYRYFEHPAHGKIPIGWGIGPAVIDLMPAVAQWYYEQATPADEFIADVSGIFYVFPQTYGSSYRERSKVVDGFLKWTSLYMDRMGIRSARPHGGDREVMQRYADRIPTMHSVFADYSRRGGMDYEKAVYSLDGGMPVFHALTGWGYGRDGLLRDIREQVDEQRPAFVNAFLHNWTFDMDALQAAYEGRDADMVFVTPAQLAQLYRQARDQGWVE